VSTEQTQGFLHWRWAIPAAATVATVFSIWDHLPIAAWTLEEYYQARILVFLGSGTAGALVFHALNKKGGPPPVKHPRGVLWLFLIVAFILYDVVRFPVLVFGGVVDLDCARPIAQGPEFLMWVIGAPLAEEVAYRALPLTFALSLGRPGWTVAILISTSAIFAMSHIHLAQEDMFNIGIMGLFSGVLFLKTRKLWPIVLLHSVSNMLVMLSEWGWHRLGYKMCEL
jgi:membrane protease YdiL (CAAX protease family)